MSARLGKRKRESGDPRTSSLLASLPRRDNTLDQHAFVRDLGDDVQALLREYLVASFPGSPEVALALLDDVAVRHPTRLRVKELLETVEACKHAGAQIAAMLSRRTHGSSDAMLMSSSSGSATVTDKTSDTTAVSSSSVSCNSPTAIYDIACGHGLAGVLMAYRFPSLPVVCIDRMRRPCFNSFLEAFAKFGEGQPITKNLRFIEGDIEAEELPQHAFVLCIHGCNEVSTIAMSLAVQSGGGVCVLPCCIRDRVFGVKTKSQFGRWHMEDDIRYSCQVGFLAGKYNAEKIAAIDRRITNRHLAIVSSRVAQN